MPTVHFACAVGGHGRAGHFTVPYASLANPRRASDFWTLRAVEGA